jgi:hypothetical protein
MDDTPSEAYTYISTTLSELAQRLVGEGGMLKNAKPEEIFAICRSLRGFEFVLMTQYLQGA